MLYRESLIPFEGTKTFKLYQNIESVKSILDENKINYSIELWDSSYETIPNPWKVIVIDNVLSLFFAKNDKLFKITAWPGYEGALLNGVKTGMSMEEAKTLDNTIEYDEWEEVYLSKEEYWLEDDLDTKTVLSISVYIRELLDDDTFDYFEW